MTELELLFSIVGIAFAFWILHFVWARIIVLSTIIFVWGAFLVIGVLISIRSLYMGGLHWFLLYIIPALVMGFFTMFVCFWLGASHWWKWLRLIGLSHKWNAKE